MTGRKRTGVYGLLSPRDSGSFQTFKLLSKCAYFLSAFAFISAAVSAQSGVPTKWVSRIDIPNSFAGPSAIQTDSLGNTYETGGECVEEGTPFQGCLSSETLTIKYDVNGKTVWKATLTGGANAANGVDIALDSAGNVYVLSVVYLTRDQNNTIGDPEFATAKYNPQGQQQWVVSYGGLGTFNIPIKLAVRDNVYVIGNSAPDNVFGLDSVTLKYDPSGNLVWSKDVPGSSGTFESSVSLGLDGQENVYVGVSNFFSSQIHSSSVYKYDINGNLLSQFGEDQLGTIAAMSIDPLGHVSIAGGGSPQAPFGTEDIIMAKFNASGNLSWLHDFGPPANGRPAPPPFVGISTNQTGDVFATESVTTSAGSDISVVKLEGPNGNLDWQTAYNGHTDGSGRDHAVALAANSSGDVYVTGSSSDPTQPCCFANFVTIKYDQAGNQEWVQRYSGPAPDTEQDVPVAMALVGDGQQVLVTGAASTANATGWVTVDYTEGRHHHVPAECVERCDRERAPNVTSLEKGFVHPH